MFIAEQRKKENIAEYLLYMWQLEDILRAYKLDIDKVQQNLIDPTKHSANKKEKARKWYSRLIEMMKLEGVEKEGHLEINRVLLTQLNDLHLQLLKNPKEKDYIDTYYKTLPFIIELRAKANDKEVPEIETCFTALYGYLLLKLQKKDIYSGTSSAISQISNLLRILSVKYKLLSNKEK
ncbi:MAG TPA: DUF4924 family protein [Dysgonamonadaceae bacterium]|nr:DUF4924 family protein [Dysgonamonadaceae bacterium]